MKADKFCLIYILQTTVKVILFCYSGLWEKAVETNTSTPQGVVSGLIEGNVYQFRIIAVNKAGQSEPGDACKNFTAKPRFCEYLYV